MSICNGDDLHSMYSKHKFGGEVLLWHDGRSSAKEVDALVSLQLKVSPDMFALLLKFQLQKGYNQI